MHLHVPEALAGIVADIKAQKPDHIALTGDLVNISLPTEFSRAAQWLAALGGPHDVTVIPGNHDVYVATAWPESLGLWGAYIAGDGQPPATGFDVFPTLRRRGRHGAGRPVERRAEAAAARDRHARARRRSPRPRGCWPISAARACAGSC